MMNIYFSSCGTETVRNKEAQEMSIVKRENGLGCLLQSIVLDRPVGSMSKVDRLFGCGNGQGILN